MTKRERIEHLEHQISTLRAEQTKLLREQTRFEMDLWQGRVDDLEVQVHLAAMEAQEKLQPKLDQLRITWDDARGQITTAGTTATDVAATMRSGLEKAVRDIRKALLDSKSKINS